MKYLIYTFFISTLSLNAFAFDCASLWSSGFPIETYKKSFPCIEAGSFDIPAGSVRFYYGAGLKPTEVNELISLIKGAITESHNAYSSFTGIRPSAIIYTGLKSSKGRNAEVPFFHAGDSETVPMIIYKDILTESKEFQKQVLAHEYFHIVQSGSLARSWGETTAQWWVEGSADFFSNLVYPNINREWLFAESYDSDAQLFLQPEPYSTNAFFQSMAQSWGGPSVVYALLENQNSTYDAKRKDEQWNRLSRFPSIGLHFDDFAKNFTLAKISDSGGGFVPTHFVPPIAVAVSNLGLTESIVVAPFQIIEKRYALLPGYTWEVTSGEKGSLSANIYREGTDVSWQQLWSSYPNRWDLSCKDENKILGILTTSTVGPSEDVPQITLNIVPTKKDCECESVSKLESSFIGHWLMDQNSLIAFLQKSVGEDTLIYSVTGRALLEIKENKSFKYSLESVVVKAHRDDGVIITIEMSGDATIANINATNVNKFCLKNISSTVRSKMTIELPGQPPATSDQDLNFSFDEGPSYESSIEGTLLKVKRSINNEEKSTELIFNKLTP